MQTIQISLFGSM